MSEAKTSNNIFVKRIQKAYSNREVIKIIFQYPASARAIIKKGIVTDISDNGFELEEVFDGLVAYSYEYIVEVKGERDNG